MIACLLECLNDLQNVYFRYNEVCDPGYQFTSGGFSGGTGHFTQVVWKTSIELGIGRAESTKRGMKCAYIVGRYKPAGNMMGTFPENVPKGNFDRSYCDSIKRRKYYDQHGKEVTPFAMKGVAQHVNNPVPELLNSKKKTLWALHISDVKLFNDAKRINHMTTFA